jgi:hypothetical protein
MSAELVHDNFTAYYTYAASPIYLCAASMPLYNIPMLLCQNDC